MSLAFINTGERCLCANISRAAPPATAKSERMIERILASIWRTLKLTHK